MEPDRPSSRLAGSVVAAVQGVSQQQDRLPEHLTRAAATAAGTSSAFRVVASVGRGQVCR